MTKIALIVLDEIVLNTRESAREFHKKQYGHDLIIPSDISNIYDIAKLTANPVKFLEDFLTEDEWKKLKPTSNIKEDLEKLKEKGYKILIISQIEKFLQEDITELLKDYGLTFDAFIATGIVNHTQNLIFGFTQILKPEIFFYSSLSHIKNLDNPTLNMKKAYINNIKEDYPTKIQRYKNINAYLSNQRD